MKRNYKKLLKTVIVCCATACCSLAVGILSWGKIASADTAQAKVSAFQDDFSDGALDTSKWTVSTDGNAVIQNGKMLVSKSMNTNNPIVSFNMPYKNFELYYDIADVNVNCCRLAYGETDWAGLGVGTALCFGGDYRYFMGATRSGDNTLKEIRSNGAFLYKDVYNGLGTNLDGGACCGVPMCASVKVVVSNGTFMAYYKNDAGNYINFLYFAEPIALQGTPVGTIGFGFHDLSNGSYTIDNFKVVNLDASVAGFAQESITYDFKSDTLQVGLANLPNQEITGVYLSGSKIPSEQYTLASNALTLKKEYFVEYFSKTNQSENELILCYEDGTYSLMELNLTVPTYTVKFVNGATTISESEISMGSLIEDVPNVPNDKLGWYLNNKKVDLSTFVVVEDVVLTTVDKNQAFNVKLVYNDIWMEEESKVLSLQYGATSSQFGVQIVEPYGYKFVGWDFDGDGVADENGIVQQDCTITGVYRQLKPNGADFLIDFNGEVNENYIILNDLFYPGGYLTLDDGCCEFKHPISSCGLYTKQQYKDFELSMDIVKLDNILMDDIFLYVSFGDNTHQNLPYYGHKYALAFVYAYDGTQTYTIWHLFANDKVIKSGAFNYGMFDQSTNPMRENDYFRHQESEARPSNYYFKSSLSPVGEQFKIKVRLEDNTLSFDYKLASQSAWDSVEVATLEGDITGYIGISTSSDHQWWHEQYNMTIAIDNLSVKNINGEQEVSANIEQLTKNDKGNYQYNVSNIQDFKVNLRLRTQEIVGENIVIYDKDGNQIENKQLSGLIKEEFHEINTFVTINTIKLSQLLLVYKDSFNEGTLDFDIVLLTTRDNIVLSFTATQELITIIYVNGENAVGTASGTMGDTIALKNDIVADAGYNFVGWRDLNGNVYTNELTLFSGMSLEAVFERKTVTVRFVNKDGSIFDTREILYGEIVELPVLQPVSNDGFTFVSWVYENTAITQDTDIQSKWLKEATDGVSAGIVYAIVGGVAVLAVGVVVILIIKKKNKGD